MNGTPYREQMPNERGVVEIDADAWLATLDRRSDPTWLRAAWKRNGIDLDDAWSVINCDDDQVVSLFVDLCGFDKPAAWGRLADALAERLITMYPEPGDEAAA